MTRRLIPFRAGWIVRLAGPLVLILSWLVIPLAEMDASGRLSLVVIRAGSPDALGWLFGAVGATIGALIGLGWYAAALRSLRPSRRWRPLIGMLAMLLILGLGWWFVPQTLLTSAAIRQPPVIIRAESDGALEWFIFSLVITAIVIVITGARRRRRHERWRGQRRLLAIMAEQLEDGVAIYNWRGRLRWSNQAADRYLKASPEIARLVNRAAETRRVAVQRVTISETLRLQVTAAAQPDGTIRLIARPAPSDDAREHFYERFMRRIVHDMRNPLAAIVAHAGNLRAGPGGDLAAQNTAAIIENEAGRLTRLVDSLLFDARLSYVPPALEMIDLGDLLEAVYYQYDERAAREGKRMEIEKPPEPALAEVDHDLLVRALGNLIDNSLKYTPPGGSIVLSLEVEPGQYRLNVTDTGEGIPPEYLPDRIFEALVRARPRDGGSGLGLSIVRKIAELHGGSVHAESIQGAGTTLTLCLPR